MKMRFAKAVMLCSSAVLMSCLLLTACGRDVPPSVSSVVSGESSTSPADSATHDSTTVGSAGVASADTSTNMPTDTSLSAGSTTRTKDAGTPGGKSTSGTTTSRKSTTVTKRPAVGTAEALLNAASLKPVRTNCPKLDDRVDAIFAQIHKAGMSTYEKVKACYDYLVKNGTYSYENSVISPTEKILYDSGLDYSLVSLAYSILTSNKGVCDHFSAAFVVMTRAIGLESYFVGGQVSRKGGGYTGHAWVNIKLNGTYYVFDPQVQQNNPQAPYYYFCKTDAQLGKTYIYEDRNGYISRFHNFQVYPEISATIKVTGGGKTQQASLSQSSSAENGLVFPQGVQADDDGTIRVEVIPAGGKGKYHCKIGTFFPSQSFADQAITGPSTFTFQVNPGTTDLEVSIENGDASLATLDSVIFSFTVTHTPDSVS